MWLEIMGAALGIGSQKDFVKARFSFWELQFVFGKKK
jgi:hypothetical protein